MVVMFLTLIAPALLTVISSCYTCRKLVRILDIHANVFATYATAYVLAFTGAVSLTSACVAFFAVESARSIAVILLAAWATASTVSHFVAVRLMKQWRIVVAYPAEKVTEVRVFAPSHRFGGLFISNKAAPNRWSAFQIPDQVPNDARIERFLLYYILCIRPKKPLLLMIQPFITGIIIRIKKRQFWSSMDFAEHIMA